MSVSSVPGPGIDGVGHRAQGDRAQPRRARERWAGQLARSIQVSLIGFGVGGAFVNISYWELQYYELIMLVAAYRLVTAEPAREGRSASNPSRRTGPFLLTTAGGRLARSEGTAPAPTVILPRAIQLVRISLRLSSPGLAGFYLLGRLGLLYTSAAWLTLGSLFFYGYWNPKYLLLLVASIVVNFHLGRAISGCATRAGRAAKQVLTSRSPPTSRARLFQVRQLLRRIAAAVRRHRHAVADIVLPIGISFFTFTQIAYLVDTYQGKAAEHVRALRAVRHLLSAPDRRAGAASRGDDAAVRARSRPSGSWCRTSRSAWRSFSSACSRKWCSPTGPAVRRPRVRGGPRLRAHDARGLGRRARLHAAALLRLLRLLRHGDRPVAHVRRRAAAQFQLAIQGRRASSSSGGAGT